MKNDEEFRIIWKKNGPSIFFASSLTSWIEKFRNVDFILLFEVNKFLDGIGGKQISRSLGRNFRFGVYCYPLSLQFSLNSRTLFRIPNVPSNISIVYLSI